jgi:hypothetical protein
MRKLGLVGGLGLFVLASAALADDFRLQELAVETDLKAGKPYSARLSYEVEGKPHHLEACYLWSGEGPYCFKARKFERYFESVLQTNNPGRYKLEGYVRYNNGAQIVDSNRVSATIRVTR